MCYVQRTEDSKILKIIFISNGCIIKEYILYICFVNWRSFVQCSFQNVKLIYIDTQTDLRFYYLQNQVFSKGAPNMIKDIVSKVIMLVLFIYKFGDTADSYIAWVDANGTAFVSDR